MREKTNSATKKTGLSPSGKPEKKTASNIKIILIIIVLILFMAVGLGAGILYGLNKSPNAVNKYKLYEYPLIGSFFPRPAASQTSIETSDNIKEPAPLIMPNAAVPPQKLSPETTKELVLPQNEERVKQQKLQQMEDAKKISKLARLYGNMKPEEAVPILSKLDDDTVLAILGKMEEEQVSKILPLLETQRAAGLTQAMLKKSPNR